MNRSEVRSCSLLFTTCAATWGSTGLRTEAPMLVHKTETRVALRAFAFRDIASPAIPLSQGREAQSTGDFATPASAGCAFQQTEKNRYDSGII